MIPLQEPGPLVLVADDDPAMLLVVTEVLHQAGFSVIEASDGGSAVQSFIERQPDLVLLDVEMPTVDGYLACAKIRALPTGRNVPVVMVTGLEDAESIDRAYDAGATDFIAKPINWSLLEHRLRYIMRGAETLQALEASESENRALLEGIPDLIFVMGRTGLIERYLPTAGPLGQTKPQQLVGRHVRDVLPPQAATTVLSCVERTLATGEHHSCEFESALSGAKRHFESRYVQHREDQTLVIVRDISERKQAEQEIHRLAYYDTLTGLPNRQLFLKDLESALDEAEREGTMLGTLYIDLDRFKRINDTLGHGVGDAVLQSVALRIASCLRESNTRGHAGPGGELARLGGDEFVVLLTRLTKESDAIAVAQRIQDVLSEPFEFSDHEFVVTPSIGISTYPKHGDSIHSLLKTADSAMYQAKAAGRNNHKVYVNTLGGRELERLDIESELRQALARNDLDVYYQPKYNCRDLAVVGAEALVRWTHPVRGAIAPETFIGLAEETGLIVDVDRWVARRVCSQLAAWRQQGLPDIPIAINLSGQEFCHGDPLQFLEDIVKANRIDPSKLELEITENVLMNDIRAARNSLAGLKASGFRLAVDDFGTGYSSLNYLKRFPLDTLKIDRSFICDINNEKDSDTICAAIISMAHDLGLAVVAEGVESHAQLAFLRSKGCDQVQGFLLSRPMEAERFTELLTDAQDAEYGTDLDAPAVALRVAS